MNGHDVYFMDIPISCQRAAWNSMWHQPYILSVWTGLQGKGPSSWFCGFHLCGLSKQTMLSLQTAWCVHLKFIVKSFKPFLDTWKSQVFICTSYHIFSGKGHTTATCPHRVATEYGVVPAPKKQCGGVVEFVYERQLRSHLPKVPFSFYYIKNVRCVI